MYPINLTFSFEDYPHLAGFQYLKDISIPNYTSAKIIVRILEGKIDFEQIRKAAQYEEMVKPQLEALIHLKNSLDNDFNLYSFMSQMYPFITNIKYETNQRKCALLKKERIHISSNTTTLLLNKLSFCIPAYIELLRSTNRIQIIFSAIFKFPDQYL